jgi:site-specific recombinase XerD
MDGNRSREALAEFLDYLAEKGLMAKATAQARKAAASMILGVLEPAEANDVTTIDVEDIVARFGRLHGKRYTHKA